MKFENCSDARWIPVEAWMALVLTALLLGGVAVAQGVPHPAS